MPKILWQFLVAVSGHSQTDFFKAWDVFPAVHTCVPGGKMESGSKDDKNMRLKIHLCCIEHMGLSESENGESLNVSKC